MRTIEAYIESKQYEFMNHPFFKLIERFETIEEINYFVPELTFWAMTFQDILRLNEERVTDPYLKKVARHHRLEDAGHEKWFLHDKKYMQKDPESVNDLHDIAWLYSADTQATRDAAYKIVAEIYKIEDENLNIALLLTLESTGHIFFEKVANQVKKTGENDNLMYFSSNHLDVELAHAIFEEEMEKKMFERVLPVNVRRDALQMIDRCYEAFSEMFDGLVIACNKRIEAANQEEYGNDKVEFEAC